MCLSLLLLEQSALEHCAFVSVVSCSLCVFLAVFVLVCTEILSQRWRHLLGLIVWATHLTMGYTFIFSGPTVVPWDQVRSRASFFLPFPSPVSVLISKNKSFDEVRAKTGGISFLGASVPLHHFYRVHHAAVPVGVCCGVECHFFSFPHHRPHSAAHC